ncbi:MAG TPA: hypothetical protein VEX15_17525 [Nocardioidaceae bacterium]|nr:hypothetical protein [Nocardioidaceae bacterium]
MTDHSTPAPMPAPLTDAPSRTDRKGLVAGLVVGLLVGGGGVALAWVMTSDDPAAGAETDATAACLAIEDTDIPEPEDDLDLATAQRWGGAAALAMGAAESDDRFQPLADELERASLGIRALDLEQAEDSFQKTQDICADL